MEKATRRNSENYEKGDENQGGGAVSPEESGSFPARRNARDGQPSATRRRAADAQLQNVACGPHVVRKREARAAGLRRQRSRAATCLVAVLADLAARGSTPLAAVGESAGFVAAGRERAGFCRPLLRRVVAAWPSTWGCLAVVVVRREQNGAEKADKGRWLVFPLTILY